MAVMVASYIRIHECVYVHGATHAKGTDSFQDVIQLNNFEGIFQMDTVKGVYVCT